VGIEGIGEGCNPMTRSNLRAMGWLEPYGDTQGLLDVKDALEDGLDIAWQVLPVLPIGVLDDTGLADKVHGENFICDAIFLIARTLCVNLREMGSLTNFGLCHHANVELLRHERSFDLDSRSPSRLVDELPERCLGILSHFPPFGFVVEEFQPWSCLRGFLPCQVKDIPVLSGRRRRKGKIPNKNIKQKEYFYL